jgi:SAM-dependent methyltransferase
MGVPPSVQKILDTHGGIKLDIGCGGNKQPGYVGMDIRQEPGVDIVQDLQSFPWSLPDECVIQAVASHVVEHINPANFGFINFMNEVWRVLKPGAQFLIATPLGGSPGYWQDPTHVNGCNENTFRYFDPLDQPTGGQLYNIYHPKPWKIDAMTFNLHGNLEVALSKRQESESE